MLVASLSAGGLQPHCHLKYEIRVSVLKIDGVLSVKFIIFVVMSWTQIMNYKLYFSDSVGTQEIYFFFPPKHFSVV